MRYLRVIRVKHEYTIQIIPLVYYSSSCDETIFCAGGKESSNVTHTSIDCHTQPAQHSNFIATH